MQKLPHAGSFRDLIVYKKSRELARNIFTLSTSFPSEEKFSLTDQIRRSSRSIGGQIAESWGKRRYEKHFVSKLTDADGEQYETQHWLDVVLDCRYISQAHHDQYCRDCEEIGRMLNGMIAKSYKFCPPKS